MTTYDIHDIPLHLIEVGEDRGRDLEPAWAEALAALIREQGLLHPIIVRPTGAFRSYRLVAGLHRLRAFELNGAEVIPAYLSAAASDDDARLEEVMENLGRYDLIALDRCHHLFELKQIHERKYPQASRGGDKNVKKGLKATKRQSLPFGEAVEDDPADAGQVFGFSEFVAEKVGLSARSIRLAVAIWTGLDPAVRRRLHGTALAGKQTELKALSEAPAALQGRVLDLLLDGGVEGVENVATALQYLDRGCIVTEVERQFFAVDRAFGKLPEAAIDMVVANHADRVIGALQRLGRI